MIKLFQEIQGQNIIRYTRVIGLILLMMLAVFVLSSTKVQAQATKQVLLLNAYNHSLSWTSSITDGVEETLKTSGESVKILTEFMDTKQFSGDVYNKTLLDLLRIKYSAITFDAIITSDDNAINFVLDHRNEIFHDAPVVFCGVNNLNLVDHKNYRNMTGAFEVPDVYRTIQAALDQNPDAQNLFVINDKTNSGKTHRANLERVLPNFLERVNVHWLDDLSVDELVENLKTLPSKSVVLMMSFYKDRLGRRFTGTEILSVVRQACKRPIYSMWDLYLGHGIVGGMLTSGKYQGITAAEMTLRILAGEKASDITPVTTSANRYMFDYSEMKRFGIPENSLPAQSIIIGQPISFYKQYMYEIWAIAAVIVTLIGAIFMLLATVRARKRAEKELEELNSYQEILIEQRTEELTQRSKDLEIANYELKKLDELKTAVLNTVSHDLRTPLTSVLGFCKIIDRDFNRFFLPLCEGGEELKDKGKRIKRNLSIIETEGDRLTRLINDFLDLSKIESGRIAWNDIALDPAELIEQAVPVLEGYFSHSGVSLHVIIKEELPKVVADPDRLLQLLNNLVGNAAKFTDEGKVTLEASTTEGGWLRIDISDTGLGIPADEIEYVFDKFYQAHLDEPSTIISRGSGMGLAISKRIVDHYGGHISANSTLNKGSTFSFSIPSIE